MAQVFGVVPESSDWLGGDGSVLFVSERRCCDCFDARNRDLALFCCEVVRHQFRLSGWICRWQCQGLQRERD